MILKNNGQVISEAYAVNDKTAAYLNSLWKMTSKAEIEQEREKLLTVDKQWALVK